MLEVPNWLKAIGIESNAELAIVIAASAFAVAFAALSIYWRNRAREIRCRNEWVDAEDLPTLRLYKQRRNIMAIVSLIFIGVALWMMNPMLVVVPVLVCGWLGLDVWIVPMGHLPPSQSR